MTSSNTQGSCLCGTVQFQVLGEGQFCVHCHCSICRRNHGAGFVTWLVLPRDQFSLTQGADALVHFASSDRAQRSFCGKCGSSVFSASDTHPERIDIVVASLADPVEPAPQAHIFYDCRADWMSTFSELQKLGGESGLEPL